MIRNLLIYLRFRRFLLNPYNRLRWGLPVSVKADKDAWRGILAIVDQCPESPEPNGEDKLNE